MKTRHLDGEGRVSPAGPFASSNNPFFRVWLSASWEHRYPILSWELRLPFQSQMFLSIHSS